MSESSQTSDVYDSLLMPSKIKSFTHPIVLSSHSKPVSTKQNKTKQCNLTCILKLCGVNRLGSELSNYTVKIC